MKLKEAVRRGKLQVGSWISWTRRFTGDDIAEFARLSGDQNPIHVSDDDECRKAFGGGPPVVHGMLSASVFSRMLGNYIPGAIYLKQQFQFHAPVRVDEVGGRLALAIYSPFHCRLPT